MSVSRFALTAAVLVGTCAMAQSPVRFGLEAQAGLAQSDLKTYVDSKPFVGVGVQATYDLPGASLLRGRLDYNRYFDATIKGVNTKAENLELAADFVFYVDGKNQGVYFLVGPSAVRWSLDAQVSSLHGTLDTTKLGLNAGIGYQVTRNLGVEARYSYCDLAPEFKAPSIAFSANYRF
jgi:opacity protein-like surface antigen